MKILLRYPVAVALSLMSATAMATVITIHQVSPNFTITTAQPISPLFFPPGYVETDVLGDGTGAAADLGFYALNVNAGDSLLLTLNSIPSASRPTELLVEDSVGNLLALASQNANDGLGSVISGFVATMTGTLYLEVLLSPNDNVTTPYLYDLTVGGATALGPVNPLSVPEPATLALLFFGLAGFGFSQVSRQ